MDADLLAYLREDAAQKRETIKAIDEEKFEVWRPHKAARLDDTTAHRDSLQFSLDRLEAILSRYPDK